MKDDLIEIARIDSPNGLKGKMRITPYGDSFDKFRAYSYLIIGLQGTPRKLLSCSKSKNKYIIELEGITDINQVEAIKGMTLFIKREQLEPTAEDEYYWRDLIGLKVVDTNGNTVGELVDIFSTGSNDVYVVDKIKQYYIPATIDVIKEIQKDKGFIVIDTSLLEGLLD